MPRYHFNVLDGASYPDEDGQDLPDRTAARETAIRIASELLGDYPGEFWGGKHWRLEVTDARGVKLFALTFAAGDAPEVVH